jgi:hypothetical protein
MLPPGPQNGSQKFEISYLNFFSVRLKFVLLKIVVFVNLKVLHEESEDESSELEVVVTTASSFRVLQVLFQFFRVDCVIFLVRSRSVKM